MAAKIKLQRIGTKNRPFYRLVVQDRTFSTRGKVVAVLGLYHPLKEPSFFEIKKEQVESWLKKGAQPTDRVKILLSKAGLLPAIDFAALPKRQPKKAQKAAAPAAEGEAKA